MTEAQANRMIELLETLVKLLAPATAALPLHLRGAGIDREVADIILGGPDELIRQNREARKARSAAKRKQEART